MLVGADTVELDCEKPVGVVQVLSAVVQAAAENDNTVVADGKTKLKT
jgi:hypothetical protein